MIRILAGTGWNERWSGSFPCLALHPFHGSVPLPSPSRRQRFSARSNLSENPSGQFPNPPQLLAKHHTLSFTLHAGVTKDGKNSFYFDGQPIAPTLRLSPGDQLKINYINDLPARPQETCAITPCMDMTNLHFHGLTVSSPDAPQDDVLDMMAMPGQSLRYTVQIPQDHPPGLYWYPHASSWREPPTSA